MALGPTNKGRFLDKTPFLVTTLALENEKPHKTSITLQEGEFATRPATTVCQASHNQWGLGPTEPCTGCNRFLLSSECWWGKYWWVAHSTGLIPNETNPPPPPYGNPIFPVLPRTVARTVGSQNHTTEIGNIRHPFVSDSCPPLCLTRLCFVMYATLRMLKLLLFCLWASWIVSPFDRSILIVLNIGLFVN